MPIHDKEKKLQDTKKNSKVWNSEKGRLAHLPHEQRVEIARKGGQVKSERKKLAQKILQWKWSNMSPEKTQKIIDMVTDREAMSVDLLKYIEKIEEKQKTSKVPLTQGQLVQVGYLKQNVMKVIHGEKKEIKSLHVHTTPSEIAQKINELKNVEDIEIKNITPEEEDG